MGGQFTLIVAARKWLRQVMIMIQGCLDSESREYLGTSVEIKFMSYIYRSATLDDAEAIAILWEKFGRERVQADPSLLVRENFDFLSYIRKQLQQPLSYGFVAAEQDGNVVGVLLIYFYDEDPPPEMPAELVAFDNPFLPRRVGAVLGLYVEAQHRSLEVIKTLSQMAIAQAESLQVTDIDILVSAEQTGIHGLLERLGFTKAAVQYTRHYQISARNLPRLHPLHEESPLEIDKGFPAIPLRDSLTNELVTNARGEVAFLYPLVNAQGQVLKSKQGFPIYPTPIRDPQSETWVFDEQGKLVTCPLLLDEHGVVFEYQGIPVFCHPRYEVINGKIGLKQDEEGNYLFAQVDHDEQGRIKVASDGKPMFLP